MSQAYIFNMCITLCPQQRDKQVATIGLLGSFRAFQLTSHFLVTLVVRT